VADRGTHTGGRSRRSNRRAMTVGAAASLVLTVSPGLVVPNSAAAATVRPAANLRLQPIPDDDDEVAIVGYRNRMRAAGRARAAARAQANQAFRDAVAPARQALVAALAAATSGPQRRAAKIAYGDAILPAKVARKAALQSARIDYVEAAEQARIDFLTIRGAHPEVVASARYRQAVNLATAEYRAAVTDAQATFRIQSAPIRITTRTAGSSASAGQVSHGAAESIRIATADITGVFRSQVSSARATYQAKISVARKILGTSLAT